MNIIHRLNYKFSESYRIRIGVGLSPLRNKREVKALIKFCETELKDTAHIALNPKLREIYAETIRLYNADKYIGDYVEEHIGWYWS